MRSLATAATLVSSRLQRQEYTDPKTRLETRNNAKWASLAPHHKSNDYVLAEFEDVFAALSNKKILQTEEYLKLLIETANKAVNKISSVYPDHNGAFVNGTNIKTQIAIMQKIT